MQNKPPVRRPPKDVARQLAQFFLRKGYVRRQSKQRYAKEGPKQYKKGEEIRLIADSKRELALIRRLLRQAGFKAGRPFPKGNKYRQPIYGKQAVARFLQMVDETSDV